MDNKLSLKSKRLAIGAVTIGTFMGAVDSSVVNITLPAITAHFGVSFARAEWVIMAYLLVISSLLLTYGRLGDMFGHKKIYITGFGLFTLSSLLCGLSPTIELLIAARAFQAIGAGMLMSMGAAIITSVVSAGSRGKALGINAISVSVALTVGPVLGGFLTSSFGWESIFYINVPVGIIGIIYGNKVIPDYDIKEKQTFDIWGALLIFLTLICILFPLNYAEKIGWHSPIIATMLGLGAFFFLLFIICEKRVKNPAVDLSLFQNRMFAMSNLSALLNYLVQFAVALLMPYYLQQLRGMSPSEAGLMIIPMPLTTMIVAPLSGILSDRFESRYVSTAGMGIATAGVLQLANIGASTGSLQISIAFATLGLGVGMFQTPNTSAIMGAVPASRRGLASSLIATMRNVGMVIGVALSGAIFHERYHNLTVTLKKQGFTGQVLKEDAFVGALHTVFLVTAGIALLCMIISFTRGSLKISNKTS